MSVPIEAAFLLVYAADGEGRILKINALGANTSISASGKQFMADSSPRESARWKEGLDFLISQVWVKPAGYKGEVFDVTGTGYKIADLLKKNMCIDTNNGPLDELKKFDA